MYNGHYIKSKQNHICANRNEPKPRIEKLISFIASGSKLFVCMVLFAIAFHVLIHCSNDVIFAFRVIKTTIVFTILDLRHSIRRRTRRGRGGGHPSSRGG